MIHLSCFRSFNISFVRTFFVEIPGIICSNDFSVFRRYYLPALYTTTALLHWSPGCAWGRRHQYDLSRLVRRAYYIFETRNERIVPGTWYIHSLDYASRNDFFRTHGNVPGKVRSFSSKFLLTRYHIRLVFL